MEFVRLSTWFSGSFMAAEILGYGRMVVVVLGGDLGFRGRCWAWMAGGLRMEKKTTSI